MNAFFSFPKNKTGGLDGYSSEFFTATWFIIGPEVTCNARIRPLDQTGSVCYLLISLLV